MCCTVRTVEQSQLQQRRQSRDDHEGEQSSSPAEAGHHRTQHHAGRDGDRRQRVIVQVRRAVLQNAACEAVMDAVTRQPASERERVSVQNKTNSFTSHLHLVISIVYVLNYESNLFVYLNLILCFYVIMCFILI